MLDPQIVARLRSLPVFASMPPYMHERLARIAKVQPYPAGGVVFRQWDISHGFYLLLSGQGQLIQQAADGSRRVLAVVNPGQYFNEVALTQELVEQASFVLAQPGYVLSISRADYAVLPTTPPKQTAPPPVQQQPVPSPVRPAQPTAARPVQQQPAPAQPIQRPQPQPTTPALTQSQNPAPRTTPRQAAPNVANLPIPTPTGDPAAQKRYPWLNAGEKIQLMTRRHWWHAVRMMWLPALFFLALLIPVIMVDNSAIRLVLLGAGVLIPGGVLVYLFIDWRNDWLVITDSRVLRVEQQIIRFAIMTQEVGLLSVQSIKAALPPVDPVARILRYGNVDIRTAGAAGNISMDMVPNPQNVKEYIFRQSAIARRAAGMDGEMTEGDEDASPEAFQEANTDPGRAVKGGGFLSMKFINGRGDTVYRRHWSIWFRGVSLPLMLMFGGLFVVLFGQALDFLQGAGVLSAIGGVVAILIGAIWFWLADWDWRNDLYIISDNVITLLNRSPFFLQYNEDQILLSKVHNIEAVTVGLFRSLLDYGDVNVLLLGDETPKTFRDVPSPVQVREEISRRQRIAAEQARDEEDRRNFEAIVTRMQSRGMQMPSGMTAQAQQAAPNQPAAPAQPMQPQPQQLVQPPSTPQRPTLPRRRV